MGMFLGLGRLSANSIKNLIWFCIAGCEIIVSMYVVNYHHHYGSVNTSTTNVLIGNQTKGGDFLKCSLLSANGIKDLIGFASLAVKSNQSPVKNLDAPLGDEPPPPRLYEYLNNQYSNKESDKRR